MQWQRILTNPLPIVWMLASLIPTGAIALSKKDTLRIPYMERADPSGGIQESDWERMPWQRLESLDSLPDPYPTVFRMLYSSKGVHIKIRGADSRVSSTFLNDGEELYLGDVFEVFLHPEPTTPLYFEYEVNAHDRELVLLIPNLDGKILGWLPWRYEGERKVIKRVQMESDPDGMVGWSVEILIPYALLAPLQNTPPPSGTIWHANVCRLDYDFGRMFKWSWSPVRRSFHEYRVFRPIRFE
jgi:hypothetical protein